MGNWGTLARRLAAKMLNWLLGIVGLRIVYADASTRHGSEIWKRVAPFTMTGAASIEALYACARQIVENAVPGDFVECGVFKGGSAMTMALALLAAGDERDIWLYDTYEGMTAPTEIDTNLHTGSPAADLFLQRQTGENSSEWCAASIDEVTRNMLSTGYPPGRLRFVKGAVEKTLLTGGPESIALLRLDTDWYESTRIEMEVLFPRISPGGVLIVDDYNYWAGSRRAVDEFLAAHNLKLMFFPIGGGNGSVMTVVG